MALPKPAAFRTGQKAPFLQLKDPVHRCSTCSCNPQSQPTAQMLQDQPRTENLILIDILPRLHLCSSHLVLIAKEGQRDHFPQSTHSAVLPQ